MSIRDGFRTYSEHFGLKGLFAITTYRLFGLPKEITSRPKGVQHKVYLRVRTTDVSTYASILLRREYAFDLPLEPKVVVDVGANIGMASIFFANRYPGAMIIAIEAEATNFALLAKNVRPYPRIFPIHAALWSMDGEISVSEPDPATGASGKWGFVTHEGEGVKVRAVTIRTLLKERGIESMDLLKIDIEGAEKEVFDKCDWIERVGCLMIELHDRFKPGCREAVSAVMGSFFPLQHGETTLYVRKP